jgi:hypothetical protein
VWAAYHRVTVEQFTDLAHGERPCGLAFLEFLALYKEALVLKVPSTAIAAFATMIVAVSGLA